MARVLMFVLIVVPLLDAPQPGRALQIEDFYRVRTVGATAISPDGKSVAFTVSARSEDDNGTRTEAFVVATDAAGQPRRIDHDGKSVSNIGWTPTGALRYTVDRQVWTVEPGGAPVRATAPAPGTVSPDGHWTIVLRDKARPTQPVALSDFERRHEERFKGAIFDWMEFQRDGQPFPAPNPAARPAQQVVLEPVSSAASAGSARVLFDEDLRPTGVAWHPAGRLIAFAADPDWRNERAYDRPDIWTVTTDGVVTRLTNDGYVYADLEFSPDGRYLSYVRTFGTDMVIEQKLNHGGPRDLFVRPLAGGAAINLTAAWDLEPGDTRWSPDGRFIYFTATIGGESHLFRTGVPDGRVEQITKGPRRLNGISFDRAFKTIAYTVGTHEAPADLYAANIDGTGERRLTNLHHELTTEIAFSRTERLQWKSRDGTPIEGWLTYPYGFGKATGTYPLIVFSHGGPHSATGYSFDFKKQFFAANGYFVLDTNFRSSTGYGEKFKWATWGAWGDKDGEDIIAGIDHVVKAYPVDPARVGHTGHSYGGFLTNWLIARYPDRFAAAVSGAGISNWISDYGTADIYRTKETEFFGPPWEPAARDRMIRQSPLTYAGNVKTPTLFVHGEVDQRVPYEEAEQMYFALKRRGVPARMIRYAGMPHGISGHWNNVHRMLNELRWWDQYLKGPTRNGPQRH